MIPASPEWERGDRGQRDWADELARYGYAVLPVYALDKTVREMKAPALIIQGGVLVTPDVLTFHPARRQTAWHEVKTKGAPTWRRLPPGPRWEHGFDFSLLREYQAVEQASGFPVFIVVRETASPAIDGERAPWDKPHSELAGPPRWLYVSLAHVVKTGTHRPDWPKKNGNNADRGRRGEGGWLWPRSAMRFWDPADIRVPKRLARKLPAVRSRQPHLPGIDPEAEGNPVPTVAPAGQIKAAVT